MSSSHEGREGPARPTKRARGAMAVNLRAASAAIPTATSTSDDRSSTRAGLKRGAVQMSAEHELTCILVRVGSAHEFSPFRSPALPELDRIALLKAVAQDDTFSAQFPAHVARGDYVVTVMVSMSKEAPTATEVAAAVPLRGGMLLGDLPLLQHRPLHSFVYVRVQLPTDSALHAASAAIGYSSVMSQRAVALVRDARSRSSSTTTSHADDVIPTGCSVPAPGSAPFDASTGVPEDVWTTLPQAVQECVLHNHALRARLASIATLTSLQRLHKTGMWLLSAGTVPLGAVRLPAITEPFMEMPKGFNLSEPSSLLLDATRVEYASEFLDAMTRKHCKNYGVLLSGPNGVGKSAVGLLTFLACYAQRLPVVYIPNAADWTHHVIKGSEDGPLYLLQRFIEQNSDIILAHEHLRNIFLPVLKGAAPLVRELLEHLAHATDTGASPRVGVILDEVQNLTHCVEAVPQLPAGRYFRSTWHSWSNAATSSFARMDIASSHGLREFKLPSGEEHRLRVVMPWTPACIDVFLSNQNSPGFLTSTRIRSQAVFVGGGVVRTLLRFKTLLLEAPKGRTANEVRDNAVQSIREHMADDCERWLNRDLGNDDDRRAAVHVIRKLILGKASWRELKPMYDAGLVACSISGSAVPVSELAASVLHNVLARKARTLLTPVTSHTSDAESGYELEHQLHVLLDCAQVMVPVCRLDGKPTESVPIRTDFALPFNRIDASLHAGVRAGHVLYLPQSLTFAVDGIIIPKEGMVAPVVVVEASMTSPREAARVDECLKWFNPAGIISQLETAFPEHPIVVLLCYGRYTSGPPGAMSSRYRDLQTAADAREDVRIVVADRTGLEKLGVVF